MSESPKVEEYTPKEGDRFTPYLFMVIHAVDYSRKDGVFATSELNFFLGKNFLVTYHELPLKSVHMTEERCLRGTGHIARAPDRVAYTLLDGIVDNYKPALDELSYEIAQLEHEVVQTPDKQTLNRLLQIKKEVLHLRHIVSPQREVLARFAHGEFKLIRPHLVPVLSRCLRWVISYFGTGAALYRFADRHFADLSEHVGESDGGHYQTAHPHYGDHNAANDCWHLVWDEFRGNP